MNQNDQSTKYYQMIARCWADDEFRKSVVADPAAAMSAAGIHVPAGVTMRALENTDKVSHFLIPMKPTDLSDDDLGRVSAGNCGHTSVFSDYCFTASV